MEWIILASGALLGIPINIISSHIYLSITGRSQSAQYDIEGVWGEFVYAEGENQFSIGEIYYDKKSRMFFFDGTNYFNNGNIYCHWTTVSSSLSKIDRTFTYIFKKTKTSEPGAVYYGFGVVELAPVAEKLSPVGGHYISASVDGRPMAHTMARLDGMKYERGRYGAEIIEELSARMHSSVPPYDHTLDQAAH